MEIISSRDTGTRLVYGKNWRSFIEIVDDAIYAVLSCVTSDVRAAGSAATTMSSRRPIRPAPRPCHEMLCRKSSETDDHHDRSFRED